MCHRARPTRTQRLSGYCPPVRNLRARVLPQGVRHGKRLMAPPW